MAADPVPDPLPEIRRLLSADGGIPGLPQFWRDACAELAAKLPVEQQRRYLSEHLQPLDAYFRPAAESPGPLRNACEWLSSPTGLSCIYERFCSTSDAERRLFFLYESLDALRYYPLAGVLSVCHIVVPTRPWEDVKDPEFVIALTILGSSLYLCERVRESTALLETYLGLEPGDYKDRDQLRERLEGQEIKEKLPNLNDRGTYLATLAAALHMTTGRGPHQAATLLEAYLRLEQSDYEPRDKLRAKLEGPEIEEKLPDLNNRGNCLRTLAAALYMTTGRGPSEAAALLEAYLRLEPGDYEDSAKLRHKLEGPEIEEKLPDLNNRGVCLQTLAAALHQTTGRGPGEAVTLLEAYLVLEPGDYQYLDQLREQLKGHEIKEKLPSSNTRGNCLQTLAAALHMTTDRGPGHAAALLEAYLGLEPGDYQYLDQLREKLNDHEIKEKLSSPNTHGISLATLAAALHMTTDRGPGHATKLLETYLGLEPVDYQDRDQLRVKLEGHEIKEKLSNPDNRSIYLRTLADSLRLTADRGPGKAATLLVAYVRPSLSQIADSSDLQGVAPSNRLELVAAYCDCINGTDPQVLEIGRAVVEYIQSIRDRELPTYQHRADFLENAGKLWPALHRLARERIDHERKQRNTGSAEALELELALWAEQFQNRLLVERLFDDSLLASGREPGSDGASLLVDWKPWRPISEAGGPDEAGGRSPGGNEEQSDHDRLCYGTVATERRAGGQRRRMAGHALSREELLPAGVRLDDLVPLHPRLV
ncbi:MAG TPA: hypothetical protein PJ982_07545 [Lacipirellulaceae bacterium]|nr:hypothetical protein [Lacipirellulaceae bacterium]